VATLEDAVNKKNKKKKIEEEEEEAGLACDKSRAHFLA
jgi:hypothetical protein